MTGYEEDDTGPITWTGEERRRVINMTESEWRSLIIDTLARQNKKLDQIMKAMELYTFGKVLVRIMAWGAIISTGVAAAWATFHDKLR